MISAWAVHYSRRRQFTADAKARRSTARESSGRSPLGLSSIGRGRGSGLGMGLGYGSAPTSPTEVEAEKIVRQLGEYATAAKAETVWAAGTVEIASAGQAGTGETGQAGEGKHDRTTEPGHASRAAASPRIPG